MDYPDRFAAPPVSEELPDHVFQSSLELVGGPLAVETRLLGDGQIVAVFIEDLIGAELPFHAAFRFHDAEDNLVPLLQKTGGHPDHAPRHGTATPVDDFA